MLDEFRTQLLAALRVRTEAHFEPTDEEIVAWVGVIVMQADIMHTAHHGNQTGFCKQCGMYTGSGLGMSAAWEINKVDNTSAPTLDEQE